MKKMRWTNRSVLGRNSALNEENILPGKNSEIRGCDPRLNCSSFCQVPVHGRVASSIYRLL